MTAWLKDIPSLLGSEPRSVRPLSGNCTGQVSLVELADGRSVFCKNYPHSEMIEAEVAALDEIAASGAIQTPPILAMTSHLLILTYIAPGPKDATAMARLGESLARLHQTPRPFFGWGRDNFIGLTPQPNPRVQSENGQGWMRFFFEHRLMHLLQLAKERGHETKELAAGLRKLERLLPTLLAASLEAPALLHGDLWAENYLISASGAPFLIDPASYYGHREMDLALTSLFGGFSPAFYDGYQKTYPLKPGWRQREPVYQLYHLLNHWLLLGGGYYRQSLALLGTILAEDQYQ